MVTVNSRFSSRFEVTFTLAAPAFLKLSDSLETVIPFFPASSVVSPSALTLTTSLTFLPFRIASMEVLPLKAA